MAAKFRRRPAGEAPFMGPNYVEYIGFTVGPDVANVINVALVLQDANYAPIPGNNTVGTGPTTTGASGPGFVTVYLSDNSDGSTLTGTVVGGIAIGTNGFILDAVVANKSVDIVSNNAGLVDLNITKGGAAHTYYLAAMMPNGSIQVSPPIVFT